MIELVDTHQHFIYRDVAGHSWAEDMPFLAGKSFHLEEYQSLTAGAGIRCTIFMETGVDDADYQNEIRFVAGLSDDPDSGIAAMIASCRPEQADGFREWLDDCDRLNVVGYRRVLHIMDDEMSTTDTFRENVREIGRRGKSFDMCFRAEQLPFAIELARSCDETTLIIDHCGVPDIAGGALDPWRKHIRSLSELPNVYCKLAGLLGFCASDNSNLEAIAPYVDHVLETFGADRIFWGSDWPVVNSAGGIRRWIDVTRQILGQLSFSEAEAIANGNAQKLFGITAGDDGK